MTRTWIGIASADHVAQARDGGFVQLGHGSAAPLERLSPGDLLVFYCAKKTFTSKEPYQVFAAMGRILPGEPYRVQAARGFHPVRRDMAYYKVTPAPIRPLLTELGFIRDPKRWGLLFHRPVFEIPTRDFDRIAAAMGVDRDAPD